MIQSKQHQSLSTALNELEQTMRTLELWGNVCPAHERLESVEPFSYDTLELQEWLQWILIRRFRALLDANGTLPEVSNVREYAEVKFKDSKYLPLINAIRNVDSCINDDA